MRVRAIVNPSSSHGRTGKIWPKLAATLSDALGAIEVAMSSGPLDATTKTREALRDGVDLVVAVGGDGTDPRRHLCAQRAVKRRSPADITTQYT